MTQLQAGIACHRTVVTRRICRIVPAISDGDGNSLTNFGSLKFRLISAQRSTYQGNCIGVFC